MSIAHSQRLAFLRILERVRPQVGRSVDLPQRIEASIKEEKAAGSRDRRLYRELVYTWLRHRPWLGDCLEESQARLLATLAADLTATAAFKREFALQALPAGLSTKDLLPAWFYEEAPDAAQDPLLGALNRRSPLWLRLRSASDFEAVSNEFQFRGWSFSRSEILPTALRMQSEADVTRSDSYESGLFEVQDLGSQLILAAAAPKPGSRWFDACAGAGGKSLQLAMLLGKGGHIDAHDIRHGAMEELMLRARRAGLSVWRRGNKDGAPTSMPSATLRVGGEPDGQYDGLLLDVPCSGTGTWRRAPHLKWSTSHESVLKLNRTQTGLLAKYAPCVKVGGRLVYATCSLCRSENEAVIEAFLAANPAFKYLPISLPGTSAAPQNFLRILPQAMDTDGYFVCVLERVS